MDASIFVYVFVAVVVYLAIWVTFATLNPVEGIWHRDSDGIEEEYIQIEQFGPFITAKRNIDGGNHQYSGLQTFNTVKLSRRDFGIPALIAAGFPSVIAKKINGSIMAKVAMKRQGPKVLAGLFRPQKVLFDESSGQVLSRKYQPAIARVYRLTDLTELPNTKSSAPRHSTLPKPDEQSKKKKRNTF